MKTKNVKMTIEVALVLNEMINALLYDEHGNQRDLPFRLQYNLNRNKILLEHIVSEFLEKKTILIGQFGKSKDNEAAVIDSKDKDAFEKKIFEILDTEIEQSVVMISMDDLNKINDSLDLSNEAVKLFISYMVNDDLFLKDIETEITFKSYKSKKRRDKKRVSNQ